MSRWLQEKLQSVNTDPALEHFRYMGYLVLAPLGYRPIGTRWVMSSISCGRLNFLRIFFWYPLWRRAGPAQFFNYGSMQNWTLDQQPTVKPASCDTTGTPALMMVCRLNDWLTDWLTDWLMTDWPTDWPSDWQTDQLTYQPTDRPTDWLTIWLIVWLSVWLNNWASDRPTDLYHIKYHS